MRMSLSEEKQKYSDHDKHTSFNVWIFTGIIEQ
jgi:hypothetical protein